MLTAAKTKTTAPTIYAREDKDEEGQQQEKVMKERRTERLTQIQIG